MKASFWKAFRRSTIALGCALTWAAFTNGAGAATIPEPSVFGYANMRGLTPHPTLLVLVDFGDTPTVTFDTNLWDHFVFDTNDSPATVNGYYNDVSAGQFSLSRGATIRMTLRPENRIAPIVKEYGEDGTWIYHSLLVSNAMVTLGESKFATYDTSNPKDGIVNQSELLIMFIVSGEGAGGVRGARATPPGWKTTFDGGVTAVELHNPTGDHTVAFYCHELTHLLGAVDHYGIWGGGEQMLNHKLTLMSETTLCHLDAWHKMQFGWVTPRIFSTKTGGSATIPVATSGALDFPVLLYNEDRGTSEFFMLEYRQPNHSYELELAGTGLVIWHVYQNEQKNIGRYVDVVGPAPVLDWYFCEQCNAFVRSGDRGKPCPGAISPATAHKPPNQEVDRVGFVPESSGTGGEGGWSSCTKCGCIYYHPMVTQSYCKAGGTHSGGSDSYAVRKNVPDLMGLHWNRHCTNCQQLILATKFPAQIPCAAPAKVHQYNDDNYTVLVTWNNMTLQSLSAPNLLMGSNQPWAGGMKTPELTWYDGTRSGISLFVRPFATNATSIVVDWITHTWVDFGYAGLQRGTFSEPYSTIAAGVSAVSPAGTLHIKSGHSLEKPRITKAMRIEAYGGPVTVGR